MCGLYGVVHNGGVPGVLRVDMILLYKEGYFVVFQNT